MPKDVGFVVWFDPLPTRKVENNVPLEHVDALAGHGVHCGPPQMRSCISTKSKRSSYTSLARASMASRVGFFEAPFDGILTGPFGFGGIGLERDSSICRNSSDRAVAPLDVGVLAHGATSRDPERMERYRLPAGP
jgi:hypothetical protein